MQNPVMNEIVLFVLLALGAVGIAMALPRRGLTPAPIGGLIAAAAGGLIVLFMSAAAWEHIPNLFFYIFALVGLGGALRMVTHPKPVYAALYFVLTILASAGLFVLLAAEFLAFALIIIYAGAILITYMFVLMLATQAPAEADPDELAEYDAASREPVVGAAVGFLLLAVLTVMMFRGVDQLPAPAQAALPPGESAVTGFAADQQLLAHFPGKIERALRNAGLLERGEGVVDPATGMAAVDPIARTVRVFDGEGRPVRIIDAETWPTDLQVYNVEAVGWDLLALHPGSIEIAGVILLMAMLGAVVLARRQVQLDEEAKARHAEYLMAKHGAAYGGAGGTHGTAVPGGRA